MRWHYRLRQFFMRVWARMSPPDKELAQSILSEEAYLLFSEMSSGDQSHSLCVLRALRQTAEVSPELEQAALLHDVGKAGAGLTLFHRALIVLLEATRVDWLERLAIADSHSWRYPFHVHLSHAEMGAARCARAGCSSRTVMLVRYHEADLDAVDDASLREQLAALRRADNRH